MLTRARHSWVGQGRADDGFVLIEVLVSALILAIVAGAVLGLITATTRSAASERNHSVAYGLAQEDQARLRTMRLSSLIEKNELNPNVVVAGTKFEVRSQGRFVNNTTGSRSCASGDASPDYVEITSTVSSPTLANPVSLHSIISPSNGSLDPSHGTLAIQAVNGAGNPVSGVTATISGLANATASTEEEGCVIFADIPAGSYKLTTSAGGLINRKGQISEIQPTVSVPAEGTQQVQVNYDRAGKIVPKFVYAEPGKELQAATIDSMMVYDSENSPAALYGSPGKVFPTSPLEAGGAFPFPAPYFVYAGSCVKDEPAAGTAAMPSINLMPGETANPPVQVPALEAVVTYEGAVVQGARVVLTDTKCPEVGTKVKRTFTTNKNGHVAVSTTAAAELIGLPWSTYKVCASAQVTNRLRQKEYRKLEIETLPVETVEAPVVKPLSLSATGSRGSGESSFQC